MNYLKLTTYRAGLLQARAYRNLSNFMAITLRPHGLAVTEWAMLGLLNESKGLRPGELSEELGVTKPLASRHIKRLCDEGWMERNDHDLDARGALVCLTPAGKQLVADVEKRLRHEMRSYLNGISLRQLTSYLAVLEQLAQRDI